MDAIRRYLEQDALARRLGIELVDVSPGAAVTRMTVRDEHMNSFGIVHGGAVFALADCAFAASSNSHGTVAVALNATISFLKAGGPGTLTATAREVSASKKIGTYAITVTDETGDTVALFQGMVYRKRDAIPGAA